METDTPTINPVKRKRKTRVTFNQEIKIKQL